MESDTREVHLDNTTLNRFADRVLPRRSAATVREHLRSCAACRHQVQLLRALSAAIRAVPAPKPPDALFDEMFPEDLKGGVTPLALPRRRVVALSRSMVLSASAFLALALAAFVLLTVRPDRVMAGASTMRFGWKVPGTMELEYGTPSPLAAESALRARMRYWVRDSLRFAQTEPGYAVVELSREDPGLFSGAIDLPPGTAYAVAAIEDVDGAHIDTDFGRFWEYLETDAEGRPTLQARRYQVLAALESNAPRAAEMAQRATSEFPRQPEFWFWLLSFELDGTLDASVETLRSANAARLDELDRAARDGNPGPVEIDALSRYARLNGRTALADYWWRELRQRYPRHGAAALADLQEILLSGATTEEKLEALEEDWVRVGAPATARVALRYSYELADPVLTERWLGRYESSYLGRSLSSDTDVARDLMEVPDLWPLAERWIVGRLAYSGDWVGSARRLDESRYNFDAGTHWNRAYLFLYLSRIRLDRGDPAGGIDALERSVEEGWDPRVFVRAAEIHESLGSDVRAAQLLALAQVDPVRSFEPYLPTGDDVEGTLADTQLAAVRAAMQERIMAGLLDEYVNLDVALLTETGEETSLEQAAGPGAGVTIVLHTIRPDLVPNEAFSLLTQHSERLDSAGVRTVFVSEQPDVSSSETPGTAFRFHYDRDHLVWSELRAWRELQYFVLDRGGRLRHRGEDLETALRISLVLAM